MYSTVTHLLAPTLLVGLAAGRVVLEGTADGSPLLITDTVVQKVRNANVPWHPVTPGQGPLAAKTVAAFTRMLVSASSNNDLHALPIKEAPASNGPLPAEFDARAKWWECETVSLVRDQGDCGSCWAFGTTSAISDRVCIHSNAKNQTILSAIDVMTCCTKCWDNPEKGGCEGGSAEAVYKYWRNTGIVTGDNYGSMIGCQPYPLPINLAHGTVHVKLPECSRQCTTNQSNSYEADRHYASEVYMLKPHDIEGAMREIMTNGPITAHFTVYNDFPAYKSGIYVVTDQKVMGGHYVEIIGWGTENGTDYWTMRNSWNKRWGEHGYFRVRRGTAESGFEKRWMAGIPKV